MIDCHCHLEQKHYSEDRDEIIGRCRQLLKAVITCCTHPDELDLTLGLVRKYRGFIFATASIHPEFIKEIDPSDKEEFFKQVESNRELIVGIGETGLDFTIKEEEWREKQRELFLEFIGLARSIDKPLIIHARRAFEEAIEILENQKARKVMMHFFTPRHLLERVMDNGWYISVNTTLLSSKKIEEIVRDAPLERILTETDSPWLGIQGKRNDPTSVRLVIERIAEIKGMSFEDVSAATTENAIKFFGLGLF